jgi:hypothetical protein
MSVPSSPARLPASYLALLQSIAPRPAASVPASPAPADGVAAGRPASAPALGRGRLVDLLV